MNPRIKIIAVLAVILLFLPRVYGQDKGFLIVSYNVENLFDTINAPGFDDGEFTPRGSKAWNSERYNKKIASLAKVISSVGDDNFPDIVGLQEVENRKVLEDLVSSSPLKKAGYGIIHAESPDKRGIDVALLYRKETFQYEGFVKIPVAFPFDSSETTRDILYVYGKAPDGMQLHFFVNHWTSRIGGEKETEPKRMYCAVALRRNLDLLLSRDSKARIVIMGDFNDDPTNKSLMNILMASDKRKNISVGEFYNLMYEKNNLGTEGTYNYHGVWYMPDQIIVSQNLLNVKSGLGCTYDSGKIFKADWMLYKSNSGEMLPDRTYGGEQYYGGFSDHLPVYLRLSLPSK
jgi:exonuclease III